MCWYGKLLSKQVAKKDIHCKKVIAYNPKDKYYFPYYVIYGDIRRYEIGKTYTSNLEIRNIRMSHVDLLQHCHIEDGLHCYSWDVTVVANKVDNSAFTITAKTGGIAYYSFDEPQLRYPILVDCIIPKGATYYENDYGEIVTNTLKLVKIIGVNKIPYEL
jgi:hypothetical protein